MMEWYEIIWSEMLSFSKIMTGVVVFAFEIQVM